MVLRLLYDFASGAIPGTEVQKLALAAWRDRYGRDNDLSKGLAKACRWGHQVGNIFRDILRAADRAGLMRETARPYILQAPVANGEALICPTRPCTAG